MSPKGYTPEEPIVAIATALAPAALGIIRCSGTGVIELFAKLFSRPKALMAAEGNTIVYGWIVEDDRRIDQVLISVFRSPRSFTGEDMVEINCHGGPGMVTEIFRLLTSHGFRAALPGEFTFRSFINGKADLTRSEAVHEIISAKTDTSRSRAAGRLAGGLFQELDEIKTLLRETLAALEAEIEYPEDEEAIADAFDSSQLEEASRRLASLCSSWASEKLYQDGARVVLCGRTNAGKSSLFNTLLKEDRSIVSDVHGTTRDWIESWVSFGGIPARLFDTAGLRESHDEVERHGIQRTQDLTAEADLMLYLVDASQGLVDEDKDFLQKHSGEQPPLVLVLNKWDKVREQGKNADELQANIGNQLGDFADVVVHLSAKTGEGTAELVEEVKQLLSKDCRTHTSGQVGLGSARQKECAQAALEATLHGLEVAQDGYTLDAVVQDVEEALESLGEITGEVTTEDILDTVFSKFCLGK